MPWYSLKRKPARKARKSSTKRRKNPMSKTALRRKALAQPRKANGQFAKKGRGKVRRARR